MRNDDINAALSEDIAGLAFELRRYWTPMRQMSGTTWCWLIIVV